MNTGYIWTLEQLHFQSIKCLDKYAEQDDERKSWAKKQNSNKGFEKNEHTYSMEKIFLVSDFTACQYSKLAGWIRSYLSSNCSKSDKQKI